MFCKHCGTESVGPKKFCTNCGNALPVQNSETPPRPVRPPMPKEPWTARRIILTSIGVLIVGWIIFANVKNSADSTAIEKNNNALTAYDTGNSSQAISQFKQASQEAATNNTKVGALVNLAYAYSSEGQSDLALSSFKEALPLADLNSVDYFLISGEIADMEGKPNAALIAFNKAYAKDPENYQVNNSLALLYLDLYEEHTQYADYKKALGYAQKANQLSSTNISKKNLALAYFFNENYAQTISLLGSVDISKEPMHQYFLGLAYAKENNPINAKYYFGKAEAGGIPLPKEVIDYINNN